MSEFDQSAARLDKVCDNLARTGLRAIVIPIDALEWSTAERFEARVSELPPGLAPSPQGWMRTLPGQLADTGGLDGFFVVRLRDD